MKIQIVNNQDEPIGVKERGELDYATDIYRISALWLTNTKGESLLAKRARTKDKDPGKWGPAVAGTVDEGETYRQNIYKEAAEEIGLSGVTFTEGVKMHTLHPRQSFTQWYTVKLDRTIASFTRQVSEVDALEWVNTEQLKAELQANPSKYIPNMQRIVDELGL